jgi:hypothetical protein
MGQGVGGSSSTGAKLPGRIWLSSTERNVMCKLANLLIRSLKALENAICNDRGTMGLLTGLALLAVGVLELEVVSFMVSVAANFFGGVDAGGGFILGNTTDAGREGNFFVISLLPEKQMGRGELVKDSI